MRIKTFLVEGTLGPVLPGGKRKKTLHSDIEKATNKEIKEIEAQGGKVIDINTETDFASLALGGSSIVTIKYDGIKDEEPKALEAPVEEPEVEIVEEEETAKKRGPGRPRK